VHRQKRGDNNINNKVHQTVNKKRLID